MDYQTALAYYTENVKTQYDHQQFYLKMSAKGWSIGQIGRVIDNFVSNRQLTVKIK